MHAHHVVELTGPPGLCWVEVPEAHPTAQLVVEVMAAGSPSPTCFTPKAATRSGPPPPVRPRDGRRGCRALGTARQRIRGRPAGGGAGGVRLLAGRDHRGPQLDPAAAGRHGFRGGRRSTAQLPHQPLRARAPRAGATGGGAAGARRRRRCRHLRKTGALADSPVEVWPFADARQALQAVEHRRSLGKNVLEPPYVASVYDATSSCASIRSSSEAARSCLMVTAMR
jgi:hypothetical protein